MVPSIYAGVKIKTGIYHLHLSLISYDDKYVMPSLSGSAMPHVDYEFSKPLKPEFLHSPYPLSHF